jgi:iron-sulfur cluster assembly accessory protein
MVTLTQNAVKKVQEFMSQDPSLAGKFLRLVVEAGGCSGFQYGLTFDVEKPGDKVQEIEGLKVLVGESSQMYLEGAQIDYVEGIHGSGFSISNPQAKSSCGCGKSFSA